MKRSVYGRTANTDSIVVSSIGPSSERKKKRSNARNVRLYYPYWQTPTGFLYLDMLQIDRFFKVRYKIRVSDPTGTSCKKCNSCKTSGSWESNTRPWISRLTLYRLSHRSRCRELGCEFVLYIYTGGNAGEV